MFFVTFPHCVLMCVKCTYCNIFVLAFVWLRVYVGVQIVSIRTCSSHEGKMPLKTAFRPFDSICIFICITTCDLSVSLTLLPLLRLMLLRADSLASRLWCPGCCCCCWWSCSLWICSLMLLASWMAFITASWSPNSAVEFRLERMSVGGGRDRKEKSLWLESKVSEKLCIPP